MESDTTPGLTRRGLRFARAIRHLETTDALELQIQLHRWTCENCGAHRPRVYCTPPKPTDGSPWIRNVQCRSCKTTGKVVT